MVTRNKSRKPERVQDSDFVWERFRIRAMADWMGVLRQLEDVKGSGKERSEFLKAACLADLVRAQKGYEVIVLMREPTAAEASALAPEMESRMYGLLSKTINEHKELMGETASKLVHTAADDVKASLAKFARAEVTAAAERKAPIVIKEGGKVRKVSGVLPAEFERMVKLASKRIPILLVGPAGCGKTYLAEKLAEALGLTGSDQSCSEGMSESVFNGRLLPIGKGGAFEHVPSPFMQRYETGGIMLLDEIDAGDPNLFTYINKAVANSAYTVDQRWLKPVVKKHKDFVLVAAANTFGNGADAMYVGRNQLDAATLDRFRVGLITMDYSREVEASLAPAELCEWAWKIRERIQANKLRRIMSTRVIKDLATMTEAYGWSQHDWHSTYFTGWTEAERKMVAVS